MNTITEALSSAVEMIGAIDGSANIMTLALAIGGLACVVWGVDRLRRPL